MHDYVLKHFKFGLEIKEERKNETKEFNLNWLFKRFSYFMALVIDDDDNE
jgi:hypothetical protein